MKDKETVTREEVMKELEYNDMKRLEYLQTRINIAREKLGENMSSLEYSKDRCDKLIDEIELLKQWIRELKGYPNDTVTYDDMTGLGYLGTGE